MKRFSCMIIALMVILSGCSMFKPRDFSPLTEECPQELNPSQILKILQDRHPSSSNLWNDSKIILSGNRIDGKQYFNGTLLYQEPDKLRLRGSRMITSTLFEFILNGEKAALILNGEKKCFIGKREEFLKYPELTMGLDPAFLPRAFLIQEELIRLLKENRFDKWSEGKKHIIFISKRENGQRQVFMVRKKDLLVREAAIYENNGSLKLRLRFNSYNYFNSEILPEEIDCSFPSSGMNILVKAREYKRPPHFNKKVFDVNSASKKFKSYPLTDLLESSGFSRK
jgi:uncharacterized protein DUF4292